MRTILKCFVVTLLPAGCVLADFSYEQTSRLTGGAMASMMKVAGVFSKQAREPIKSTVMIKGDRMATLTPQHASIIDVGKETITEVDFQKKTWSVMTFAEMKQMLEELSRKSKDPNAPEMNFKVSAQDTGATKDINGMATRETILKMIMETTDKKGNKGSFAIISDMWLAPAAPGYDEVKAFQKKMAAKLNFVPGSGFMQMGGSEIGKGMAELYKESANLNGIPVYQVIRMGAEGMPQQQGGAAQPAAQPQQQAAPQEQQQANRPSLGGVLGGRLGGRLGGFGRKPKQPEPQQQPQQQTQQQTQQQGAPALLEMTSEMSGFSAAGVDAGKFEVPAGFKQVKPQRISH